jgi:hypothetical protein
MTRHDMGTIYGVQSWVHAEATSTPFITDPGDDDPAYENYIVTIRRIVENERMRRVYEAWLMPGCRTFRGLAEDIAAVLSGQELDIAAALERAHQNERLRHAFDAALDEEEKMIARMGPDWDNGQPYAILDDLKNAMESP